jgi:hypothetical protein
VCNFDHSLVAEQIRLGWHESGRPLADAGLSHPITKVRNSPTPSLFVPGSFSMNDNLKEVPPCLHA